MCEALGKKLRHHSQALTLRRRFCVFDTHVGDVSRVGGQGPAGDGLPWTQMSRQLQPRRLHGEGKEWGGSRHYVGVCPLVP